MRESRTSGSVRGDRGNPVPYRYSDAGAELRQPMRDGPSLEAARRDVGFQALRDGDWNDRHGRSPDLGATSQIGWACL
jgi:hypothetical protein